MVNVIRKSFGVLVIDGIVMHSPVTIDSDRPGEFKILYTPGDEESEISDTRKTSSSSKNDSKKQVDKKGKEEFRLSRESGMGMESKGQRIKTSRSA